MIPILTPEESAALDRESEARGVTTDLLMENAGQAVARAVTLLAGGTYGRRAVVVCGKGNNGGDGLVAARHLARQGMGAAVLLLADPSELRGPTAANLGRHAAAGGRWRRSTPEALARELGRADIVIDAIFGTGFRGGPEGEHAAAIEAVNGAGRLVLAVDIPSGVDGSSGAVRGAAIDATATVTFGALKPGLVFHPGATLAGIVSLVDIGFPADLVRSDLGLVERDDVAALLPEREADTHKRSTGVLLIVAGSRAMTGAAVLVARAATRAGAGLVTLAVPEGILPVVEAAVAETTFLPLPETPNGTVAAGALPLLRERLEGANALAVGPGMTTEPETAELNRSLVAESPVPVVLDADGLNAFAGRTATLAGRRAEAVLTPHAGEFARLTGIPAKDLPEDRVGHARKAAAELGCTVLLKGSRTVVAEPSGRVRVNPTGGSYLATAGTGDVLTGTIAAFLAQGEGPADAAVAGAYVHGLAGRLAAEGASGRIVASDVVSNLPAAIAEVLA
jgi:ADP-dependent NAD(P)H-hydrate dehydratase / NAD(P)H-hydrate epimerase